jgi:hypothetical protein
MALEFIERKDSIRQKTVDKVRFLRDLFGSKIHKALNSRTPHSELELLNCLLMPEGNEKADCDSIIVVLQFYSRHQVLEKLTTGGLIRIAEIALKNGSQDLFDLVFDNIPTAKTRHFVTGNSTSVNEDNGYSIFRIAALSKMPQAFERTLKAMSAEDVEKAVKFDDYFAFRMAMTKGHFELGQRIFDLISNSEEKFSALKSLNNDIFTTAIKEKNKVLMDKFLEMVRRECPDREKAFFIDSLKNLNLGQSIFYFRQFVALLNADEIKENIVIILHHAALDNENGHLILRDIATKLNDQNYLNEHLKAPSVINGIINAGNARFLNVALENLTEQQIAEIIDYREYHNPTNFNQRNSLFHFTSRGDFQSPQIMARLLEVASPAQYDSMLQTIVPNSCSDRILLVANTDHLMLADEEARSRFHDFDNIADLRHSMQQFYFKAVESYVKNERVENFEQLSKQARIEQKLALLTPQEKFLIDAATRRCFLKMTENPINEDSLNFGIAFGQRSRDESTQVPTPVEVDAYIMQFLAPPQIQSGKFSINDFKQRKQYFDLPDNNGKSLADLLNRSLQQVENTRNHPRQLAKATTATNLAGVDPYIGLTISDV